MLLVSHFNYATCNSSNVLKIGIVLMKFEFKRLKVHIRLLINHKSYAENNEIDPKLNFITIRTFPDGNMRQPNSIVMRIR